VPFVLTIQLSDTSTSNTPSTVDKLTDLYSASTAVRSPPRSARGVPYKNAHMLAPLPAHTLAEMRTQGRTLVANEAVQLLRQMVLLERDLMRWQHDLARHVQIAPRAIAAPNLTIEPDDGLIEYRMELADLQATYTHHRNHSHSESNVELMHRLSPYLHAAPRFAPAPGAAPGGSGAAGNPGGGGVQGLPMGLPDGVDSLDRAYAASDETLARLFQNGCAINYNHNARRVVFADRSYVEIQAYIPVLSHSNASGFLVTAVTATMVATLPVTAPFTGGATGVVTIGMLAMRPYDAAWQGYVSRFYRAPSDGTPTGLAKSPAWQTRYFYGWARSPNVFTAVSVNGREAPESIPNLADRVNDFGWESWFIGNATQRTPQYEGDTPLRTCTMPRQGHRQQAHSLIQHLSATHLPGLNATPLTPLQDPHQVRVSLLAPRP